VVGLVFKSMILLVKEHCTFSVLSMTNLKCGFQTCLTGEDRLPSHERQTDQKNLRVCFGWRQQLQNNQISSLQRCEKGRQQRVESFDEIRTTRKVTSLVGSRLALSLMSTVSSDAN
jgi:hypothetical protein